MCECVCACVCVCLSLSLALCVCVCVCNIVIPPGVCAAAAAAAAAAVFASPRSWSLPAIPTHQHWEGQRCAERAPLVFGTSRVCIPGYERQAAPDRVCVCMRVCMCEHVCVCCGTPCVHTLTRVAEKISDLRSWFCSQRQTLYCYISLAACT